MKQLMHIYLLCGLLLLALPLRALAQANQTQIVATTTDKSVDISVVDNRIVVLNAPPKSKMEIYSIVGTKIREIELKNPSGEYAVSLSKGYYIVRVANTVRKIIIR